MIVYLIKKDDKFFVKKVSGFKPSNAIAIVPDSFDESDHPYLYAELETDPDTNAESWVVKLDAVAKGDAINEQFKVDEKIRLREEYIADIDAEMTLIYDTIDRDKASSMYLSWQLWLDDPSFFSDKGLIDDQGNALDTASKISTYAQQKINQCKDYAVFLMNREKQYKDAVALLEA